MDFLHHKTLAFYIVFNSAILIGLFLKYFRTLKIKSYLISNIIAEIIIFASAITYHKFVAWLVLVPIVSLIGLLILILKDRRYRINLSYIFGISIILLNLMVSFVFIKIKFILKIIKNELIHFILIQVYIVQTYSVH